jgi:Zn-dependent alcohol dehydrogenase
LHILRDLPRYVKLIEKGLLDVKSMVTSKYPLDRAMDAVQAVADRTMCRSGRHLQLSPLQLCL